MAEQAACPRQCDETRKYPDISVIMPVYNSDKYLSETIESVLGQTYRNFELILVDDGSRDESGKICDAYAEKDARIRVIHKQNGGISSARNCGLKAARGEYLAFCDNDDKYLPDLLRDNYTLAKKYDADIVRFKRLKIAYKKNGRQVKTSDDLKEFAVLRNDDIAREYFAIASGFIAVWSGLYRRKLVKERKIRFPEQMKYGQEDGWFNFSCYEYAECVVLNPKIYYYWIQREIHSTTGKFHVNLLSSMLTNMKKEWGLLEKLGTEKYQKDCFYLRAYDYMKVAFAYMNQKNCPYHIWQKAGILRQFCKGIPDISKITERDPDKKIKRAIIRCDGWALYYMIMQLGLEW